ncbi:MULTISPECIES: uridine kinase [Streptacidiphilus]|uniref:Uridine kinase n=1 Tax=Streptacidiphilus cavernicola TaxID=3342716 RepID=A0ABV6UH11_9ACTN|nr:uridine kinase [Streptacidiphilus jeojiense]
MEVRPLTPAALADTLAERVHALPLPEGGRLRVAVDGAPAADPGGLAEAAAALLRLLGRPVVRVSAADYLRPASLRLEYGHQDADAYFDGWLDTNALFREVFDPLEPGGSGLVLPALWDARADRAVRALPVPLPPGGVLLLDGPLLLGRWLPLDLTVHLRLSPAALERRTPEDERWTLPAFARYEAETLPTDAADLVVRADDPRRPALVVG